MELAHEDQVLLFGFCPYLNETRLEQLRRSLLAVNDYHKLLAKARWQAVLAPLAYNLQQHGLDELLSSDHRRILSAARQAAAAVRGDLQAVLRDLVGSVGQDLRDLMLLKGFDLVHSAYPHPDLREMRDLDILVHREDIGLVRRALLEAGLLQGRFDPRNQKLVPMPRREIERAERAHYECLPFRKLMRLSCLDGLVGSGSVVPPSGHLHLIRDEVWYSLEVDVHHNLAPDIKLPDVWAGQRPVSIDGLQMKGQSPEALLWFVAARVYHEVMLVSPRKLFQLHDVIAILHRWGPQLDWLSVLKTSSRYHFHPSLYYVLLRVHQLFDAPVPQDVLRQLCPTARGVSRLHDWGDFLPKMLGYCEVPEITFAG